MLVFVFFILALVILVFGKLRAFVTVLWCYFSFLVSFLSDVNVLARYQERCAFVPVSAPPNSQHVYVSSPPPQVADTLGAKAIVVFTSRGTTVQKAAQLRPNVPVMGVTPNIETARGLALTWGVYPAVIETPSDDVNFRMMLFKVRCS